MRYLDRYVRIAAEKFEKELLRVAITDKQAKIYSENAGILKILADIKSGELTSPSKAFEPYSLWFFADSKFSDWAVRMYYMEKEESLFTASADLSNVLRYRTDTEFANYCQRLHYVFPDGWPNDPVLLNKTVEKEAIQIKGNIFELKLNFLERLKRRWF